jgi:hypothetical protein
VRRMFRGVTAAKLVKAGGLLALFALLSGLLAPVGASAQSTGSGCQFLLGFKTLHDFDPDDVGDCMDNQSYIVNGDAEQHTSKGLLAWRRADNWTAFTNGTFTWILGPDGVVSRANTDRFPWEAIEPTPVPAATATPQATATPKPIYAWYYKRPQDQPQMCGVGLGNPCLESAPNQGTQYVSGHIIDKHGAPVFGIIVQAKSGLNLQFASTDQTGYFSIPFGYNCPATPQNWDVYIVDGAGQLSSYVYTIHYSDCAKAGEFHIDFVEVG